MILMMFSYVKHDVNDIFNDVLGVVSAIVSFLTVFFNSISLFHLLQLFNKHATKRRNSTTLLYINLGVCDVLQVL